MITLSPSILTADFSNLERQIKLVEAAGADMLHIDVMDGAFVPNITFGPCVISSIRKVTDLPFDVHLMIEQPERYIEQFARAGADYITIHTEATHHTHRTLQLIHAQGKKAGIALNPGTSVETVRPLLDEVDMVLVMTVNPGFGGQAFIPSSLEKIKAVKDMIAERSIDIEVDGGINPITLKQVSVAGANVIVAGSAIFNAASPAEAIQSLREAVH